MENESPDGRMDNPLVSVITPSFNSARFIEETILSVLNQDYPHIEHIIVDGGSTDGTVDILRKYDGRVEWVSEPDRGQSDALNKGLKRARGEIIGWLNADDTYCPGAVSAATDYLVSHPEVGMICGDCVIVDGQGHPKGLLRGRDFSVSDLILGNCILQQSVFLRRDVIKNVGGWDAELHYIMDYELWLRVALSAPVHYVPSVRAKFRIHPVSKTMSAPTKFQEERLAVLERLFANSNLPAELVPLKRRAFARAHLYMACARFKTGAVDDAKYDLSCAFTQDPELLRDHERLLGILVGHALFEEDPAGYIRTFFDHLPPGSDEVARLRNRALSDRWLSQAFMAFPIGDMRTVRQAIMLAILYYPGRLCNRGVVSMGLESLLGGTVAAWMRSIGRRLFGSRSTKAE